MKVINKINRGLFSDYLLVPSRTLTKLAITDDSEIDYYQLLAVSQHASVVEIKAAYHQALLQSHPDKKYTRHANSTSASVDISLIKEAYLTLSSPESRMRHDGVLRERKGRFAGSRPAQIVSLEEFEIQEEEELLPSPPSIAESAPNSATDHTSSPATQNPTEHSTCNPTQAYTYPCRCGGTYKITTDDMERGHHLVGCVSCSEVIWVGYEVVEDEEGNECEGEQGATMG